MESRIFYRSKSTGIWLLVAFLLMTGISCFGLLNTELAIAKRVFAGILIPVFVFVCYNVWRLQISPANKRTPALTIDEKGVGFPEERIIVPWEILGEVQMVEPYKSAPVIYLHITDRAAILNQYPSGIRERKSKQLGDAISITPMSIAGDEDIFDLIKKYYRHYGPKPGDIWFRRPGRETWPTDPV